MSWEYFMRVKYESRQQGRHDYKYDIFLKLLRNSIALLFIKYIQTIQQVEFHKEFFKCQKHHLARTNTNLLKQKKVFTRVNIAVNLVKYKTKMSFGLVCLFQTQRTISIEFCSAFSLYNGENECDHEGTRTLNLPIRSRTPYPLGHAASQMKENDL